MSASSTSALPSFEKDATLERFKSFLRIKTVSHEAVHTGANEAAVAFLRDLLDRIGMKVSVHEFVSHRPVLIGTIEGTDASLPSILLNSHYDVVPTMNEHWKNEQREQIDPFLPYVNQQNQIVARGTQDMKSVCMQYIEALFRLRAAGKLPLKRTIHVSFMPDEEIGGFDGMGHLIRTPSVFEPLRVAFALDEGLANEGDAYTLFYGERAVWWLMVRATGPTGHGSRFVQGTAMEKLIKCINRFLAFRSEEEEKLKCAHVGCAHAVKSQQQLGDVVTINLTALRGGVTSDGGQSFALNVIPQEAEAGFDIRIPPTVNLQEFEKEVIQKWIQGEDEGDSNKRDGMTYKFVQKATSNNVTSTDERTNPFYAALKTSLASPTLSTRLDERIFPAGTDGRFLRSLGIPVLGFSPIKNTPVLLHDHNERLGIDTYLHGIYVYEQLIEALATVPHVEKGDAPAMNGTQHK